jgi:hypothetical protein
MANDIGWGQGAINNTIGWGQGSVNNTIGWGSIHSISWAGETDIVGLLLNLSYEFKTRVLADGGIIEAETCLSVFLGTLIKDLEFNFNLRIKEDNGNLEAESCLNIILTNLNNQ